LLTAEKIDTLLPLNLGFEQSPEITKNEGVFFYY